MPFWLSFYKHCNADEYLLVLNGNFFVEFAQPFTNAECTISSERTESWEINENKILFTLLIVDCRRIKKRKTRWFHFNSQRKVRTPNISSSWSVSISLTMTAGKMVNIDYGFQNKQRWCHREWQPWRRTKSSFWLLSQKCFDNRQWF